MNKGLLLRKTNKNEWVKRYVSVIALDNRKLNTLAKAKSKAKSI